MINLPKNIKLYDEVAICWGRIMAHVNYESRCMFLNGSTGQPDSRFHHFVIISDIPLWEVVYFDKEGEWVTQSVFESLQDAIDHAKWLFEIPDYEWTFADPSIVEREDLEL